MNDLKEIQRKLAVLTYYPVQSIDGLYGVMTQTAIDEFKQDYYVMNNEVDGKLTEVIGALDPINGDTFTDRFLKMSRTLGMTLQEQAYALATFKHETKSTFKPVEEAYWLSDAARRRYLNNKPYGLKYAGRGYIQLTWRSNYKNYAAMTNLPLLDKPHIALDEDVSLLISLHGLCTGLFTGKKLTDYINRSKVDYKNARRVVNGTDDMVLIANFAEDYEKVLRASKSKYIGVMV